MSAVTVSPEPIHLHAEESAVDVSPEPIHLHADPMLADGRMRPLSAPFAPMVLELASPKVALHSARTLRVTATADGMVHAVLIWVRLLLCGVVFFLQGVRTEFFQSCVGVLLLLGAVVVSILASVCPRGRKVHAPSALHRSRCCANGCIRLLPPILFQRCPPHAHAYAHARARTLPHRRITSWMLQGM